MKTRLYEALVLSMLLNSAELWPVLVTNEKKLEAAHHRWQRSILWIFWKDKVTNEKVREATALTNELQDGLDIFHEWITNKLPRQALIRELEGFRSTATELGRCRQERSQENGHQLGRG